MDGRYHGQPKETWSFMATPLSEQTTVGFIAVNQVYMSSCEARAKATPNAQKNCFPVKPALCLMRTGQTVFISKIRCYMFLFYAPTHLPMVD